ncbi:MAG TPA: HIT family protein [Allosphingosinicella sp.]|jgi:diadenosine tetraphosphate (Ap4A) HIT family hydrolase
MNETIRRFGHPATLVAEYAHWTVLLRPAQPTLASLILAAKSEATAFSELDAAAFAELQRAVDDIEGVLAEAVGYAKINYLMLMMVDPHVHFHVLPRYEGARSARGVTVTDAGWPKAPALSEAVALDAGQIEALTAWLRSLWPSGQ